MRTEKEYSGIDANLWYANSWTVHCSEETLSNTNTYTYTHNHKRHQATNNYWYCQFRISKECYAKKQKTENTKKDIANAVKVDINNCKQNIWKWTPIYVQIDLVFFLSYHTYWNWAATLFFCCCTCTHIYYYISLFVSEMKKNNVSLDFFFFFWNYFCCLRSIIESSECKPISIKCMKKKSILHLIGEKAKTITLNLNVRPQSHALSIYTASHKKTQIHTFTQFFLEYFWI